MVYAPPGATERVYCGMNVPPALIETIPAQKMLLYKVALAFVANVVALAVWINPLEPMLAAGCLRLL